MRYEHTQDSPATTWIVRHNLYTRSPIVEAFVEVNGVMQKILPSQVKIISNLECHILWTSPRIGTAGVI